MAPMGGPADWFLTADERGNPDTRIDARHPAGQAWSEGNRVVPLVHGARYYERLHAVLCDVGPGDRVLFTDWRGDADQQLLPGGAAIGDVLADAARRGADVRGLMWRSHARWLSFSEQQNRHLGEVLNAVGAEVLLDERVRRLGSHHQKLVVVERGGRPDAALAFVGGIDLCHSRRDDAEHRGDHQQQSMDSRYGDRAPWHDVQLEVHGPAVADLAATFRERWEDPTPLDHRNPWRGALARAVGEPRRATPLGPPGPVPGPAGTADIQVLRTYGRRHPPYPFARRGERSVARGYLKALGRARRLVYLEDQYLWSAPVARVLAEALRRHPRLVVIGVVPRYPDADGAVTGPPNRTGRLTALRLLREAGGDRVAIFDVESPDGYPVYVHAKVMVIDDVLLFTGSDNLNRRSWTSDSELCCAVLDRALDPREPRDPGGLGDGARVAARSLRLSLWAEHLGVAEDDPRLLDAESGLALWRERAAELAAWTAGGRRGAHPPGRAGEHHTGALPPGAALWVPAVYRNVYDPDGRRWRDRMRGRW